MSTDVSAGLSNSAGLSEGRTFYARDLMKIPCDDIWNYWGEGALEKFNLVFDDGVVTTNVGRTAFSRYHWELLQQFPEVPVLKSYHFTAGMPSVDTSLDLFSNIVKQIHTTYKNQFNYEELWRKVYQQVNALYNSGIVEMEAFQIGGTALDLLRVYKHPDVWAANSTVKPNKTSIKTTQDTIAKVIMTAPELDDNHYVRLARSKAVKLDQFCQIIGPRGWMTELTSEMFKHPITRGYFQGIISLHDSLIESRSAAKSLYFNKKPLRDVEYFNRKMQLLVSVVHTLVYEDCGTSGYLETRVDANLFKGLEGMNFFDEEQQLWRPIYLEERSKIVGKTLKVRAAMFCRYRGSGTVCSTCFGEISWSIPYKTNLGHVSATEMCQEGSQLVLSVKHYDGSAVAMDVNISDYEKQFIVQGSDTGLLQLNSSLQRYQNVTLMLEAKPKGVAEGASGISDIRRVEDLENVSAHRLTSFTEASLELEDEDGDKVYETVTVSSGPRLGSLTLEFLRYALDGRYVIGDDNYYHVDMSDWDYSQDVFTIPLRHMNTLDYMSEIEAFLRSSSDNKKSKMISKGKRLVDYTSAQEALLDLYEMTSQRLSVNVTHLSVILLSFMRGVDDYRLPEYDAPARFETYNKLLENRSHGQLMFYEGQPKALMDVNSYLRDNRPQGLLDPLLML